MPYDRQRLAALRQHIVRLNILIQKYRQIKNTLNNSFLRVTRVNTNTNNYRKPRNYKILLQQYMNKIKGRRSRYQSNNNNNNENERYRRYR